MPSFSRPLEESLHRAVAYANQRKHEYATLEHLLLSLVDDEDAAGVMRACDVDLGAPVGEQGCLLSAGQRRRVAVARALVRDAALVLLDEPTEDLDAVTEARLVAGIAERLRGRTVLLVAHRPLLLPVCEAVVDLGARQAVPA